MEKPGGKGGHFHGSPRNKSNTGQRANAKNEDENNFLCIKETTLQNHQLMLIFFFFFYILQSKTHAMFSSARKFGSHHQLAYFQAKLKEFASNGPSLAIKSTVQNMSLRYFRMVFPPSSPGLERTFQPRMKTGKTQLGYFSPTFLCAPSKCQSFQRLR